MEISNDSGVTWATEAGDGMFEVRYISTTPPSSTFTDWKGSDLTKLDSWCIGTAINMGLTDAATIHNYIIETTDRGAIINDAAGGYFTVGIPAIARERPKLFATAQYKTPLTTGTAVNAWDSATAWQTFVGATIAGDVTTIAIPFGITGKDLLAGIVMLAMLGCVMAVLSSGMTQALGAAFITVPILWLGFYFRIVTISVIVVAVILSILFAIRQFVVKTL
jgi:hypothetical protein